MKKINILANIFLALLSTEVFAHELLVLSGDSSKNSKRWQEEVLPEYTKSDVGKTLPVKIISVQGANFPGWFSEVLQNGRVGEILGTPTFIIWDVSNKKELGRVEGYTQKSRFYYQLNEALVMVEKGLTPSRREGSGGNIRKEGSGGNREKEGSSKNQDIMEHMYKSSDEAKRASEMLGYGGEIHSHKTPDGTIYMPGPMM